MAVTNQQVAELYVATFNRAPDADGLDYWVNLSGLTIEQIAQSFFDQPETQTLYPTGTTDAAFVTSIYTNLFNRAPDAAGLAYWEAELSTGAMTRSVMIEAMKNGALGADATIIANKATVALYYAVELGLQGTDFSVASVTAYQSSVTTVTAQADNVAAGVAIDAGQTYTLTKGLDNLVGTDGNDTFNGSIDSANAELNTMAAIDTIDGGAGIDTFKLSASTALANTDLATLSNVEIMTVNGANTVTLDTTLMTGLTNLNTTKSTNVDLTAAATTDVSVSGATGTIDVVGAKNVVVTDATTNKAIVVGNGAAGGDAAGTITITDTDNTGAATITTEGGTNVTVTTTADKATSGAIVVGHATNGQATGAVVVTQNSTSNGTAMTAGNVTVTGGSTVDITANMTNTAVKGGAAGAITAGIYTVTGGNATTAVTVTQNATATDFANDAAGVVKETTVVTFNSMASGETLIMNGLTFTASKALTASEVAEAFAGLTAADTQDAGGSTAKGFYTGTFNTAVWTTAAANGAVVTFTAQDNNEADIVFTGTATTNNAGARIPTQVKTAGAVAAAPTAVDVTADLGAVVVDDNATASITSITLNNYDTATLGAGGSLNALTTLSLSNSAGANALTSTSTTLTANLAGITGATNLGANVQTLTVNTSGAATATALTAGGLKYLTVNAAANLTVTPTSIAALETLTVTGAANVTMGDISAATTTITAGTATGAISATVDGTKATVTTGSGADSITVDTAGITKAINLGAGNDTLTLATDSTTLPTAAVNGGADTDTISMTIASAVAYDNNSNFATAISGFERLVIRDVVDTNGGVTVDLEALGFSYVTTSGTDDSAVGGDILTLNNMAANGTVVLTAVQGATNASTTSIVLKDATGSADVLNVTVSVADTTTDVGTLTVASVETINVTAYGVMTDANADGIDDTADIGTLNLVADTAATVNVDGYADLTLTTTAANLTTVNASGMTGALTYTAGVASSTITGGTGADQITVNANGVTINAGAGDDKITINNNIDLVTIDGGAGNDTFLINTSASTNKSNYAVFNNVNAGDIFDFENATTFNAAQITLSVGATQSTQAYLDQAVTTLATNGIGWFQYNGNTFIVADQGSTTSFLDGTDQVVMITGLVDLTTASFNTTNGTLEIA